jgi:hypothetical protein
MATRCVVNPFSVTSSGGSAVLVEDPAEAIAAHDRPRRQRDEVGRRTGSPLLDPLMGPGVVVVADELGQHPLHVPATEDQHPVSGTRPVPFKNVDRAL